MQKVLANNPALGLNAALGVYLGQILILFIILLVLRNATFFDTKVFASVIAVCAVVWTGLIIVALSAKPAAYVAAGIDTGTQRRPGRRRAAEEAEPVIGRREPGW
ncbi:MAG: hypothetical protein U0R28_07850 [Candidatus Nanopelagicales bacterium]